MCWQLTVSTVPEGIYGLTLHIKHNVQHVSYSPRLTSMSRYINRYLQLKHSTTVTFRLNMPYVLQKGQTLILTLTGPLFELKQLVIKAKCWQVVSRVYCINSVYKTVYWLDFLLLGGKKSLCPINIISPLASSGSGEGQILPSETHKLTKLNQETHR